MKNRLFITALMIWCAGFFSLPSGTSYWQLDTHADFSEGRGTGISITHDGRIILAPLFKEILDSEQPYILSAARDNSGNVFLGTGHDGKVFRIDPHGKISLQFDAEEPDIFALALGPNGVLYVGTSPGGKVYAVSRDGKAKIVVDLGCRYIWSLTATPEGILYAATGVEGKLYKIVKGETEAQVFYDSSQMHIMSLCLDLEGNLLAGTAPDGYVLKLIRDGSVKSIFDSPHKEVHQILVDRYDRIYILGIGKEEKSDDVSAAATSTDAQVSSVLIQKNSGRKKKTRKNSGSIDVLDVGKKDGKAVSALYRIMRDLTVQTLWYSTDTTAFAFLVKENEEVLLGTNDNGRILSLRDDRFITTLVESGQQQITVLLEDKKGVLAFSSNLGKIFLLEEIQVTKGKFISDVADMGTISHIGRLHAIYSQKQTGASSEFHFRSGNTAQPDKTWSQWQGPVNETHGWRIPSPPARYFQIKVVMSRSGSSSSQADELWVEEIDVSYLQQNQAPRMISITVNPPGILYLVPPKIVSPVGIPEFGKGSSLTLPDYILSSLTGVSVQTAPSKVYRLGGVSLSWKVWDPNGNMLDFSVYTRKPGTSAWTRLASDLRKPYVNINKDRLADGKYFFRIVASDRLSNTVHEAKEDSLVSKLVVKDSTPPAIRNLSAAKTADGLLVRFDAVDALSPLHIAEVSQDGGKSWDVVVPTDRISDQLTESYSFESLPLKDEVHLLLVRVMDYAGNLVVASVEAQ